MSATMRAEQPRVLIDGDPAPRALDRSRRSAHARARWWCGPAAIRACMPVAFRGVAGDAAGAAAVQLPFRRGDGELTVGWAILRPQPAFARVDARTPVPAK